MSYDYGAYASNDNSNSGSSSGSSGGSGGGDNINLTMVPHAAIEGDLVKVFGNDNSFGQSLGLSWENVELVDGCLYYDSEKDKHKLFPWKDVVGVSPEEDDSLTADQANQYLVKNYGGTEKRYELVEAVVPETDEPVEIGDAIMWYSGSNEYGPKSASKTLAKILTKQGRDMVIPEEESTAERYIKGWLRDTSAADVTREDLSAPRFSFFEVKKQSNRSERQYHHPIVVDVQTGAQVTVANATDDEGGDTSGTLDGDSGSESGENEAASGDAVPEPIDDFISTCESLGFTDRDRAATLLGDLMADDGNDLTADMVDEFGGEDAVLDEVAA